MKDINMKPIDYYLAADYPITIYKAPEGGYVAEIEDLPGCLTEGETSDEALKRIEDARRSWIETAYEDDIDIPEPRTERRYSGKFVVRIARSLHRRLAEQAHKEGVSLNQYVETVLAQGAVYSEVKEQFKKLSEPAITVQGFYSFTEKPAQLFTWGTGKVDVYPSEVAA